MHVGDTNRAKIPKLLLQRVMLLGFKASHYTRSVSTNRLLRITAFRDS